MQLVTIDFETYYDHEFSLSKMATEDYVTDTRFEIIGVAIKIDNGPTTWHPTQHGAVKALRDIDWERSAMLAHHTMFDALVLLHHVRVKPRFYFDTKSMAQAVLKPFCNSASLASVSQYLHLGQKGREVIAAKGKRLMDFSASELHAYGEYCRNDVDLTYKIFQRMMETFPKSELFVIDRTLRMYLEPVLELDADLLERSLQALRERKAQLLANLPRGVTQDDLMSNPKLAEVLLDFGVQPPMKVSPTTGKLTLAMAKTDPEFTALCDHEDERVQAVMAARIGTKSTIAETRTERFLDIARRHKALRVPLVYYGAHTGRWSGTEGINIQNLPRGSDLRKALMAPDGHSLLVADFKQIEARVLAWAARQHDLVQAFLHGHDVYSLFASILFNKPTDLINAHERFIGKTCILGLGYGMGPDKFGVTLKSKGIDWPEGQVKQTVWTYRNTYELIRGFWSFMDSVVEQMARAGEILPNFNGTPVTLGPQMLYLPNDMALVYNHLQLNRDGWEYKAGRSWKKIYGAKLTENWVQAVSRIIMTDAALRIDHPMVLTVHDELVFCVPDEHLDSARHQIETEMVKQPEWAAPFGPIPLAVELSVAKRYGDAK